MIKKLIIVALLAFCFQVQAQDAYMNESKYWFYRYRLLTEFMVTGEASCGEPSGLSIPCVTSYSAIATGVPNDINDELGQPFDTRHNYGDGTSYLGYYIAVLATEHKLMQNYGAAAWQVDKVKEELYFAMKAFERVDKNAENMINSVKLNTNCNDNANGFFLRDDVPASFNDPIKARALNDGFRYRDANGNKLNRQITSNYGETRDKPLTELTSSHAYMSVDQCTDLMVGFSLVTKLMDNEVWKGYNFKYYAREYTNRIVSYVKDHDFFIPIPGQEGKCFQPVGPNIDLHARIGIPIPLEFQAGFYTNCLAKHGAIETRALAYPFAQAGNMIYNDKLGAYKKLSINPSVPTTYNSSISVLTKPIWKNIDYPVGINYLESQRVLGDDGKLKESSNDYNNAIFASLAAIGNSWETGYVPTKFFDEDLTLPNVVPCWKEESGYETVCGLFPFQNDCHNIWVEGGHPGLCDLYLGRLQVYCYTMPSYIQTNAFYSLLDHVFPNTAFSAALTAFVKISAELTPFCVPIINPTGSELIPRITYNTTGRSLSKYADLFDLQLYPLLHRVLHDSEGDYSYSEYNIEQLMNTAPCNGPHYKPFKDPNVNPNGEGDIGIYRWRNDNNFQKTVDPAHRSAANASFPGLDYMLFYNLYTLVHSDTWATPDGYRNQMNVNLVNKTYPYSIGVGYVGSDVLHKKEIAYDYLLANNIVVNAGQANTNQNGNVAFKAGERIEMKNMSIKSGSNFKAYIEKSTPCSEYNTARVVSNTQLTQNKSESILVANNKLTDDEYEQIVKIALEKEVENYKSSVMQQEKKQYQSLDRYIATRPASDKEYKLNVNVYPNPSSAVITLSTLFDGLDKVEIIDGLGNLVYEKVLAYEKNVSVSIEPLPIGIYYLKMYSGDKLEVKKIIKSK